MMTTHHRIHFPRGKTAEEKDLMQKYDKLRKLKTHLHDQQYAKSRPVLQSPQSEQRKPEKYIISDHHHDYDKGMSAKDVAMKLIRSGKITIAGQDQKKDKKLLKPVFRRPIKRSATSTGSVALPAARSSSAEPTKNNYSHVAATDRTGSKYSPAVSSSTDPHDQILNRPSSSWNNDYKYDDQHICPPSPPPPNSKMRSSNAARFSPTNSDEEEDQTREVKRRRKLAVEENVTQPLRISSFGQEMYHAQQRRQQHQQEEDHDDDDESHRCRRYTSKFDRFTDI